MFKCPKCHKTSKDPYTIYIPPDTGRPIKLNGNELGIVGPAVRVRCGQCGNEELMLFDPDVAEKFRLEAGIKINTNPVRGVCPNCHHDIIWESSLDGTVERCPNCHYVKGEEVIIPMKTVPGYSQDIDGNIVQPSDVPCSVCGTKMLFADNKTRLVCPQCARNKLSQEIFPSGAVRGKDNTPTYTLIPACALRRLAKIYETGNIRYPDNQWRKGIPVSNIVDHALEHLMKWLEGSRTEDHLAKVAWAMFSLMYYESVDKLEDDVKWDASSKH